MITFLTVYNGLFYYGIIRENLAKKKLLPLWVNGCFIYFEGEKNWGGEGQGWGGMKKFSVTLDFEKNEGGGDRKPPL